MWGARLSAPSADQFTIVADRNGEVVGFVHMILDADPRLRHAPGQPARDPPAQAAGYRQPAARRSGPEPGTAPPGRQPVLPLGAVKYGGPVVLCGMRRHEGRDHAPGAVPRWRQRTRPAHGLAGCRGAGGDACTRWVVSPRSVRADNSGRCGQAPVLALAMGLLGLSGVSAAQPTEAQSIASLQLPQDMVDDSHAIGR